MFYVALARFPRHNFIVQSRDIYDVTINCAARARIQLARATYLLLVNRRSRPTFHR